MSQHRIEINNQQNNLPCSRAEILKTIRTMLRDAGVEADLSVALVGDDKIECVNRDFLGREGTTDVIAFTYKNKGGSLEGELVVNVDEARRCAQDVEHSAGDELMLYVVHGILHLFGFEDDTPEKRRRMHERALELLEKTGRKLESDTLLEE
ncbi:MAG: rRNA maturation RNase YbeY [Candidatus Brocadiia bacterium]